MKCPRCSFEFVSKQRTTPQNRRYFGVVVPVCREILSQGRAVPLSSEQCHEVLKSAFLGQEATPLGLVTRSTRELTTAEFADYCNRIEAHFKVEFGAVFPDERELAEMQA